jgi:hypothetical protein
MKPGKRENKPGKRENRGGQVYDFKKEIPSKNKKKQEKTGCSGEKRRALPSSWPVFSASQGAPEGCERAGRGEGKAMCAKRLRMD